MSKRQRRVKERKAGLAGDTKPQWRRRMPSVGGSVRIKNSCQKSREAGEWGVWETSGRRKGKKKVEDKGVYYMKPFIPHEPPLSPDGQQTPVRPLVTVHKTGPPMETLPRIQ